MSSQLYLHLRAWDMAISGTDGSLEMRISNRQLPRYYQILEEAHIIKWAQSPTTFLRKLQFISNTSTLVLHLLHHHPSHGYFNSTISSLASLFSFSIYSPLQWNFTLLSYLSSPACQWQILCPMKSETASILANVAIRISNAVLGPAQNRVRATKDAGV